jgi:hypothetical protein
VTAHDLLLVLAFVCLAVAIGIAVTPALGVLAAAVGFAAAWYLLGET